MAGGREEAGRTRERQIWRVQQELRAAQLMISAARRNRLSARYLLQQDCDLSDCGLVGAYFRSQEEHEAGLVEEEQRLQAYLWQSELELQATQERAGRDSALVAEDEALQAAMRGHQAKTARAALLEWRATVSASAAARCADSWCQTRLLRAAHLHWAAELHQRRRLAVRSSHLRIRHCLPAWQRWVGVGVSAALWQTQLCRALRLWLQSKLTASWHTWDANRRRSLSVLHRLCHWQRRLLRLRLLRWRAFLHRLRDVDTYQGRAKRYFQQLSQRRLLQSLRWNLQTRQRAAVAAERRRLIAKWESLRGWRHSATVTAARRALEAVEGSSALRHRQRRTLAKWFEAAQLHLKLRPSLSVWQRTQQLLLRGWKAWIAYFLVLAAANARRCGALCLWLRTSQSAVLRRWRRLFPPGASDSAGQRRPSLRRAVADWRGYVAASAWSHQLSRHAAAAHERIACAAASRKLAAGGGLRRSLRLAASASRKRSASQLFRRWAGATAAVHHLGSRARRSLHCVQQRHLRRAMHTWGSAVEKQHRRRRDARRLLLSLRAMAFRSWLLFRDDAEADKSRRRSAAAFFARRCEAAALGQWHRRIPPAREAAAAREAATLHSRVGCVSVSRVSKREAASSAAHRLHPTCVPDYAQVCLIRALRVWRAAGSRAEAARRVQGTWKLLLLSDSVRCWYHWARRVGYVSALVLRSEVCKTRIALLAGSAGWARALTRRRWGRSLQARAAVRLHRRRLVDAFSRWQREATSRRRARTLAPKWWLPPVARAMEHWRCWWESERRVAASLASAEVHWSQRAARRMLLRAQRFVLSLELCRRAHMQWAQGTAQAFLRRWISFASARHEDSIVFATAVIRWNNFARSWALRAWIAFAQQRGSAPICTRPVGFLRQARLWRRWLGAAAINEERRRRQQLAINLCSRLSLVDSLSCWRGWTARGAARSAAGDGCQPTVRLTLREWRLSRTSSASRELRIREAAMRCDRRSLCCWMRLWRGAAEARRGSRRLGSKALQVAMSGALLEWRSRGPPRAKALRLASGQARRAVAYWFHHSRQRLLRRWKSKLREAKARLSLAAQHGWRGRRFALVSSLTSLKAEGRWFRLRQCSAWMATATLSGRHVVAIRRWRDYASSCREQRSIRRLTRDIEDELQLHRALATKWASLAGSEVLYASCVSAGASQRPS